MKNIIALIKERGHFKIVIILLVLLACQGGDSTNDQENAYKAVLSETLFKKLLYNPDLLSNLRLIADGENNFNVGELSYNRDVTFYIKPQFMADSAGYYISHEEFYVHEYQTEIFLEHEGERTNRLREFSGFEFDESNFFDSIKSIQSNYILLDENQSIDELLPNGIIISFYKPDQTANSVYQIIKMTNVSETRNTILTISFSLDKLHLRSFSISSSY